MISYTALHQDTKLDCINAKTIYLALTGYLKGLCCILGNIDRVMTSPNCILMKQCFEVIVDILQGGNSCDSGVDVSTDTKGCQK